MSGRRFIVKVQVSLTTTKPVPQALVYNESRTIDEQFDAYDRLIARVGPRMKRYFWAHINHKKQLSLDNYAPEQTW